MDDELKAFDEKMKLTNLQIDKRLAILEEELAEIRENLRNVTEEIVSMKNSLSKAEKAQPISSDIADLTKQFRELKAAFNDIRSKLTNMPVGEKPDMNAFLKRIEKLEKKIALGVPIVLE